VDELGEPGVVDGGEVYLADGAGLGEHGLGEQLFELSDVDGADHGPAAQRVTERRDPGQVQGLAEAMGKEAVAGVAVVPGGQRGELLKIPRP
jgi:hypothetical protein